MGVLKNDVGRPSNKTIVIRNIFKVLGILIFVGLVFELGYYFKDKDTTKTAKSEAAKSIKIDESKDYVYDADYKYNNNYSLNKGLCIAHCESVTEFSNLFDGFDELVVTAPQNFSELKVPYININSEDATTVNKIIEALYKKCAWQFDQVASAISDGVSYTENIYLYYRTFQSDNYLSVIVISGEVSSHIWLGYQTYTFDLTTGKLLTYDETLKSLNLTKDEVNSKIEKILEDDSSYDDFAKSFSEDSNELRNEDIVTLNKSLLENQLFFIDEKGNLNLICYSSADYESSVGHVKTIK